MTISRVIAAAGRRASPALARTVTTARARATPILGSHACCPFPGLKARGVPFSSGSPPPPSPYLVHCTAAHTSSDDDGAAAGAGAVPAEKPPTFFGMTIPKWMLKEHILADEGFNRWLIPPAAVRANVERQSRVRLCLLLVARGLLLPERA